MLCYWHSTSTQRSNRWLLAGTRTRISVLLAYWHHLSHHFLSFIPWNLRLIPHDEHKLYLIGGDLPIYDTTPKTVLDCARDGEPSPIAKFVLLMQEVVKLLGVCVNAAARTRTSSVFSAHNRWWYGKDYNFRLHLQASPLDYASRRRKSQSDETENPFSS